MKKIGIFTILLSIAFMLTNCSNGGLKTHPTGLMYRFITQNNDAVQPQVGDVVTLRMRFTDAKGTTIEQTDQFRTQLKKASHTGGSIEDAIALMHKGDSAIFLIDAKSYYTKTLEIRMPERFQQNEKLHFYIKLVDVVSLEAFEKERHVARLSGKHEEDKLLKAFDLIYNLCKS